MLRSGKPPFIYLGDTLPAEPEKTLRNERWAFIGGQEGRL